MTSDLSIFQLCTTISMPEYSISIVALYEQDITAPGRAVNRHSLYFQVVHVPCPETLVLPL